MGATIDGIARSFNSITVRARGKEYTGITGIKYGQKISREKVYGTKRYPLGRTKGKVEIDDATITFLELEYRALIEDLGDGYADVPFEVVCQYDDDNGTTHTDVLENCLLGGDDGGGEEGPSGLTREVMIDVLKLKRDGYYIVTE